MDETEARGLLRAIVAELRTASYPRLVAGYLGETAVRDVVGDSGVEYCVEIQGMWDTGKPGDLRIIAGIDDGRFPAVFRPLTEDFVMAPDGSFVGE